MNHLSQDNWSPGRDLKPAPPEYKAEVLTTRPQCSVLHYNGSTIMVTIMFKCEVVSLSSIF
jgi:hypothetical protein